MSEEFEVMDPNEDGWSDWVHPVPGYRMKCCDCGLVHEMEFAIGANAYGSTNLNEGEDASSVIVFRARRSLQHRSEGTMSEKLKPCPFCGSPAELEHGSDHHGEWFNLGCSQHWERVDPESACVAGRLWYTETEKPEAEAIAAWNRRAPNTEASC